MSWLQARDTPFKRGLYSKAKRMHEFDFHGFQRVYRFLYNEREVRKLGWRWIKCKFYYQPMLRARCTEAGVGLVLFEGIPKIIGNLNITLGDRVRLEGQHVWMAAGDGGVRELTIGDHTYLGYDIQIVVGTSIRFGRHVLVANRVLFNGYDGHPLDPFARARNEPPQERGKGPIIVEDYAWIGSNAIVLKGVTIGRGAVVASGSVVTRDVESLTVVAGNPARVIRQIPAPEGWGA